MNPLIGEDGKAGDGSPKNSRREARETILQVLYAYEFTQADIPLIVSQVCDNFSDKAMAFIQSMVIHCTGHQLEVDALIKERTQNWDFERIAIVDRLLMRMGVCEFLFCDDVPPKVSINEMIEISKRYSTDKSSKFINGILDSIFEDLKKAGRINKTGRGVIEN